jgi:hypothetical protein
MWKLGHLLLCVDALQVNCDKFLGGMLCVVCVYVCVCVCGWVGGWVGLVKTFPALCWQ